MKDQQRQNTGGDAKATDTAILVAYCEAMRQVIYTTNGGTRSGLTGDLDVSTFAGEVVETYIGFISEDGRSVSVSNLQAKCPW